MPRRALSKNYQKSSESDFLPRFRGRVRKTPAAENYRRAYIFIIVSRARVVALPASTFRRRNRSPEGIRIPFRSETDTMARRTLHLNYMKIEWPPRRSTREREREGERVSRWLLSID